ncbi:MAG: hypothetical protein D6718_06700 [Acidobacteria bacterium]|nr:MAG: hypothetical protein D6718_06700 [Acidobacteriota bacterium]
MSEPIPIAVLMCHAPVVVPEIAGHRAADCAVTTRAMQRVAERVVQRRPDLLLVVSPHTPRLRDAWGVVGDAEIGGSFGMFGFPGIRVDLPGAPDDARALASAAAEAGAPAAVVHPGPLDHGAAVPLVFLTRAGWRGPTVVVAWPWEVGAGEERFGRAIREAARRSGRRWAVVASGDMSHRLAPGAPSGYHPRAAEFDRSFTGRLERGDLRGAAAIDPALRELAAEDVVTSVAVAGAAVDWEPRGTEVLAYEGPFGVGYCEAVLFDEEAQP